MEKAELIYIYDAYCGWCFGFSNVMQELQKTYKGNLNITVYSGGMVSGERVGTLGAKAEMIKASIPRVEQMTGCKFGDAFLDVLDKDEMVNNSLFPSIALGVVKDMHPKLSLDFSRAIQKARYERGEDLTKMATFTSLLSDFNIDESKFILRYKDAKNEQRTIEEFELVHDWGITGFPTLLYRKGPEARVLTQGYQNFDRLKEMIDMLEGERVVS